MSVDLVTEKTCKDCKKTFPCSRDTALSGFFVRQDNAKGQLSWRYASRCKDCYNAWRRYLRTKITKYTQPTKLEPEERKRRQLARQALATAVWDGRVIKPSRCSRCQKKTEKVDLHGHHHDYNKRYDVTWLCRTCHMEEDGVHRKMVLNTMSCKNVD